MRRSAVLRLSKWRDGLVPNGEYSIDILCIFAGNRPACFSYA